MSNFSILVDAAQVLENRKGSLLAKLSLRVLAVGGEAADQAGITALR